MCQRLVTRGTMAKTLGLLWRLGKTRRKLGTRKFRETKGN
jgi:hypothetical protein